MEITSINSKLLAKMFLAGAKNLDSKKDWINELNVFPVPDGDTGTNMSMTIMSAAKEVLTARQTLLQAELSVASNRFDEIQGVINLYHALGGGY